MLKSFQPQVVQSFNNHIFAAISSLKYQLHHLKINISKDTYGFHANLFIQAMTSHMEQ
jgi:hypothetical protein